MSNNDEVRVKIDPVALQRSVSFVGNDGQTFRLRRERSDGELCERRTVNLRVVIYDSLMDYLLRLYGETRFSPDYLFLSEKDYDALHFEVRERNSFLFSQLDYLNERGRIVKFAHPATGKYIHMATLPNLQEGEIMVLYAYE